MVEESELPSAEAAGFILDQYVRARNDAVVASASKGVDADYDAVGFVGEWGRVHR